MEPQRPADTPHHRRPKAADAVPADVGLLERADLDVGRAQHAAGRRRQGRARRRGRSIVSPRDARRARRVGLQEWRRLWKVLCVRRRRHAARADPGQHLPQHGRAPQGRRLPARLHDAARRQPHTAREDAELAPHGADPLAQVGPFPHLLRPLGAARHIPRAQAQGARDCGHVVAAIVVAAHLGLPWHYRRLDFRRTGERRGCPCLAEASGTWRQ
mmetsp:Transcript_24342/g.78485  ORF Transcript_24342/g.78485 Transcript_24342/m.78485 type:complete len:215 (+) Transcript_24342:2529-3173(+)